jgi:hypothetical protein
MVYDASKSGLNKSLWAANFGLPTVDALCRNKDPTSWMGDLDIGEMFLNFPFHPDLQPFCGVDLRPTSKVVGTTTRQYGRGGCAVSWD